MDAGVVAEGFGEAEVVGLVADAEEVETGFLAGEAEADAGVGPAGADGLGDAAVVVGLAAGGAAAVEELVEALAGTRPDLAADPAEVGPKRLAHGAEPAGRLERDPLLPARGAEQGVAGAEGVADGAEVAVAVRVAGPGKVDPRDVDDPASQQLLFRMLYPAKAATVCCAESW